MTEETRTIIIDLPTKVKGFCYLDSTGTPVIALNARMTWEIQRKTYDHELLHILRGELTDITYKEYQPTA